MWKFKVKSEYKSLIPNLPGKKVVLTIGNVQSGKTNFMIEETKYALDGDYDIVVLFGGSNNLLLSQSFSRFSNELKENNFLVVDSRGEAIERIGDGEKIVITSLKSVDALNNVLKSIRSLNDKKIIIFDDESDFASINTSKNSKTKIFSLVRDIYKSLRRGIYVSVTATPYADILSKDSFEFDHIIRLQPGIGYKGLKEFNEQNKYICISDSEYIRRGNDKKFWVEIVIDHVKRVAKNNKQSSQLLINPDLTKKVHFEILNTIKKTLILLTKTFVGINEFSEIEINILKKIAKNVYVLNQNNTNWKKNEHSIIIGGALVSRGYTFPDLFTSVILNSPKGKIACDTLLQRARWFGYRRWMEDIKIYMPHKLIEAYKESILINEIVFNESLKIKKIKESINNLDFNYIIPSGKI